MKNKYKNVKAACFISSTHALLLYVLLYGEEQFNSTFFFVSDAISKHVREQMSYCKYLSYQKIMCKNFFYRVLYRIVLYRISYFKWPFLKTVPIYGHDHLWFTPALLKNRTMTVIEDGESNYCIDLFRKRMNLLKRFLLKNSFGPKSINDDYGCSLQAKEIILTGILEVPQIIKEKTKIVNLHSLWEQSNEQKFILKIFGLTNCDIDSLKKKKIMILTQPFHDLYSEDDIVYIYSRIINSFNHEDVVIKTHPRDIIEYKKYFPNIYVFSKKIPAELFALLNVQFADIYTITSAAIYSFSSKDSNLHYLGTDFITKTLASR